MEQTLALDTDDDYGDGADTVQSESKEVVCLSFFSIIYACTQKAKLIRKDGTQDETHNLYTGVTRIGRDPSQNDIVIDEGSISKCHCEIGT